MPIRDAWAGAWLAMEDEFADFVQACERRIQEEYAKPNSDGVLITQLKDTIRVIQEIIALAKQAPEE